MGLVMLELGSSLNFGNQEHSLNEEFRGGSRKISDWFLAARAFSLAAASASGIARFACGVGVG